VSSALAKLVERGWVIAAGKTKGKNGRPSVTYQVAPSLGYSVGISIGTEQSHLVAIDARGEISYAREFTLALSSVPGDHPHNILDQASLEARRFLQGEQMRGQHIFAIGIAVPGMVDTQRGIWLQGLQVEGIKEIEIRKAIESALGVPVMVEDTARCIAYLELLHKGKDAAGDLVVLYLGSGVGTGIILNGKPYRGNRGLAGEIGHLVVDPEGARCSCGNVGCLETVVSVPAILRRFRKRLSEGVLSSLQRDDPQSLTLERVCEEAQAGDRLAQSIMFELGVFLGDACAKLIQLYNPRTLIVGGPAAQFGRLLEERVWQTIRHQVIPEMLVDLHIEFVPSQAGDEALGAALAARNWAWHCEEDDI
jgi:predicted NBD/HSP70 family sugar kinase